MAVLVVVAAFLVSLLGGWLAVAAVFRVARVRDSPRGSAASGGYRGDVLDPQVDSSHVLRGGLWIGMLERMAITGAILAGEPGLIAAVVAIKGLGRWSELQTSPAVTERFIIGTLVSYVVAGAAGFGALALVAQCEAM